MFEENRFEDNHEAEYQHMLDSTDRHTLREDAHIAKVKMLTDTDPLSQLVKHLTSKHDIRVKSTPCREPVSKYKYRLVVVIDGIPFKSTKDAAKHFDITTTTVVARCKGNDPKYATWSCAVVAK